MCVANLDKRGYVNKASLIGLITSLFGFTIFCSVQLLLKAIDEVKTHILLKIHRRELRNKKI